MCLWCDEDVAGTIDVAPASSTATAEIEVCRRHLTNLKQSLGHGECAHCDELPEFTIPEGEVDPAEIGTFALCSTHFRRLRKQLVRVTGP